MQAASDGHGEAWLAEGQERGVSTVEALAFFDGRPAVAVEELRGRWRGRGLPTGHPWDGLLEAVGWFGKTFDGPDDVHPLLFDLGSGVIRALNPGLIPQSLFLRPDLFHGRLVQRLVRALRPLLATARPRARLRAIVHRGLTTAAMVYDQQPIIDYFRRVDADTVVGLMELRGMAQPFFFVLRRDSADRGGLPRA